MVLIELRFGLELLDSSGNNSCSSLVAHDAIVRELPGWRRPERNVHQGNKTFSSLPLLYFDHLQRIPHAPVLFSNFIQSNSQGAMQS
jgi:hypothetical protein